MVVLFHSTLRFRASERTPDLRLKCSQRFGIRASMGDFSFGSFQFRPAQHNLNEGLSDGDTGKRKTNSLPRRGR